MHSVARSWPCGSAAPWQSAPQALQSVHCVSSRSRRNSEREWDFVATTVMAGVALPPQPRSPGFPAIPDPHMIGRMGTRAGLNHRASTVDQKPDTARDTLRPAAERYGFSAALRCQRCLVWILALSNDFTRVLNNGKSSKQNADS